MIQVDIKSLLLRLNKHCAGLLQKAATLCVSRGHYEIATEHLLQVLLEQPESEITLALRHFEIDSTKVLRAIEASLEEFRAGNSGKPVFSPLMLELIQDAWMIASIELKERQISSGAILLAFLSRPQSYSRSAYADMLLKVRRDLLLERFDAITARSPERAEALEAAQGGESSTPEPRGSDPLETYCEDFTLKARQGKIDPVFGRDDEIRKIIDILARHRKNNPICVGEPGVGKTAVIEGLALRIVQNDVPDLLRDVRILGLDLGLLQAGAGVRGEFESRLKKVIDGVKSSERPVILFIDEAHSLIGAGDHAGGSDAANLLKPALARGELRTIAATTWSEYRKYFEKDAALARRFQPVRLDEPGIATTALILRGLKERYEASHGVIVRDDAIDAAAELSARYITGRFLPDKAIDLFDTACARIRISQSSRPPALEECERSIQALDRRKKGVERDLMNGFRSDRQTLAGIDADIDTLREKLAALEARWRQEKEAAARVLDARRKLAETANDPAAHEAAQNAAEEAAETLREIQAGSPLLHLEVDPDAIARVVSDWTGIPLGKVMREQAAVMLDLEKHLQQRIRGQEDALRLIAETIRASKTGLGEAARPQGVFLLAGPSGVGKTETGIALAEIMFGGERSMISINMSEYQEKHTVSRLIGSPPGYVGYGEGGVLTEAVRQKPYSVVLLDEVEKAHPEVLDLFYQVFDKGRLRDGEGREIDCRNTVIILTSNLGSDIIAESAPATMEALLPKVRPLLSRYFKPALLARMTVAPYRSLEPGVLREIVALRFGRLAERLASQHRMRMRWTPEVIDLVTRRCTEVETGARNIDSIISGNILPRLSTEILGCMGAGSLPAEVSIDLDAAGGFSISFSEHESSGGNDER